MVSNLKYRLYFLLTLTMPVLANAQVVVNKGVLFVGSDSKVHVKGDVLNKDKITNQGNISLTGAWDNRRTYIAPKGNITLAGTSNQLFAHNNQVVDYLTINNAAGVTITDHVNIQSTLTLQQGIVAVEPDKKMVVLENARVEGGANDAFISGTLYHRGIGDKFYPVGKNTLYAPVMLTNIQGDQPVTGIEFFDKSSSLNTPDDFQGYPFYWQFKTLSGSYKLADITVQINTSVITEPEKPLLAMSGSAGDTLSIINRAEGHQTGNLLSFTYNLSGKLGYLTIGVIKLPENFLYIPNAVSPMAPNAEDRTVKIYSKYIESSDFQWTIWDAWGHIIYRSTSYSQASTSGWQHGPTRNAAGVYQYLLQVRLTNGQMYTKSGTIVLYD